MQSADQAACSLPSGAQPAGWLHSGDPAFQADVAACGALMARADMLLRRAAVFSRNEELDDVKTADLPYLLTRYYEGMCHLQIAAPGDSAAAPRDPAKALSSRCKSCRP